MSPAVLIPKTTKIMKKVLFLSLAFLFCLSPSIYAQFFAAAGGGLNYGKPVFKNVDWIQETEYRMNFFAEIRPGFRFSDRLNASLGLQFTQKGCAYLDPSPFPSIIDLRLRYIDFLPQAEYRFLDFLSAYAGFNVGVKLSEEYRINEAWLKTPVTFFNDLDFGALLGIRAYLGNFYLGAHFNQSITSVMTFYTTDNNGATIGEGGMYLRNYQIGLGYVFE